MPTDKERAKSKVLYAVRTGRLKAPERCEACRRRRKLDAHHDDYTRPLDVRWLCRPCHLQHHAGHAIPMAAPRPERRVMANTAVSTAKFAEEAERRLIDTFDLMILLGLRSKQSIWQRVEAGKLPPPVYSRPSITALWDRDAIALPD